MDIGQWEMDIDHREWTIKYRQWTMDCGQCLDTADLILFREDNHKQEGFLRCQTPISTLRLKVEV